METLLLAVLLMQVSQHALGGVVEVHKGAESVLLPCDFYHGLPPEDDPHLMWTREDLSPKSVHLQRAEKDDLTEQNQRFRGRTAMNPDAHTTRNLSLTLMKPRQSDSGGYICSISDGTKEWNLAEVQLKVKTNKEAEVRATEGAESILLPCRAAAGLPTGTTVEWTLSEPLRVVHVFPKLSQIQDDLYCSRTEMKEDLLSTGDLSLTLRQPTARDSGSYVCTVHTGPDVLRQRVELQVKAPFPVWIPIVSVLAVLVAVLVTGGLLSHFYFREFVTVEVDSGAESVLLPSRALFHQCQATKVEWTDNYDRLVHVSDIGSDGPAEQDSSYRNRTQMEKNCDLILKHPKYKYTGFYTCRVYNKDGKVLMRKDVLLIVRVPPVEVDYEESALLPCKASVQLPKDARVEWTDDKNTVMHVYQNGSVEPDQQDQYYRKRTRMEEDPLGTGDLSLTLDQPKYSDTLTCSVYSRERDVLMKKEVELIVKDQQVEVEEGVESVVLPFKTTPDLPENTMIVWERVKPEFMRVHKYQKGSNQTDQQHQFYRNRTRMEEDPLGTGDLSLTLDQPKVGDSGEYRCRMECSRVRRQITIQLRVTGLPPPPPPPHPSVAPAEVARQSTQQQSRKWVPTRAGSGTSPRPGRGGAGGPGGLGGGGCPPVGIQLEGVVLPPLLTVDVVLGLLGNLLALWLFCFRLKAWNPNSLLLFNLVLADFLALVSLPLRIDALLRGHWVFGDAVCRLNLFLMFSNRTASIALMTLVALYRYFKVVHPHLPGRAVVLLWLLVAAPRVPMLAFSHIKGRGERVQCFFFTAYGRGSRALRVLVGVHRALTVLLEFLAAAALLLFCSVRIAHALRRTRRVGRPHKARARVCAVIVAVFVVCFLPSTVTTLGVWLVRALRPRDCAAFYALTQLSIASLGLNFLSSALDPLVYVFSSSGFRRALMEAVPRCCRARGGQGGAGGGSEGGPAPSSSSGGPATSQQELETLEGPPEP
ncbi:LOW QUALITY PROTEIN: uncharacterized protein ACNS7B_002114 [Menidia menidia]